MDGNKERIICAAIWYKNDGEYIHQPKNIKSGFVVTGFRHCNCFKTVSILAGKKIKNIEKVQGFITSSNRFVDRIEAVNIAYEAKQIDSLRKFLYSEDIY